MPHIHDTCMHMHVDSLNKDMEDLRTKNDEQEEKLEEQERVIQQLKESTMAHRDKISRENEIVNKLLEDKYKQKMLIKVCTPVCVI